MSQPLAFVIEDDKDMGEIFSAALREANYQAIHIQNGMEALEKLQGPAPVLVVLDLHLPKLAGTTVLRAIRSDLRMAKAYMIIVTADSALAESVRGDADAVLVKPVGFTQIRTLAEKHKQSL